MSTWTWTFVKPEYLSKKQIEKLLDDAIKNCGGIIIAIIKNMVGIMN